MGNRFGKQAESAPKADAMDGIPAYDFTEYPYLMYPRLAEDFKALYGDYDKEKDNLANLDASLLRKFYGVCVRRCPMLNETITPPYIHAYKDYKLNADPVNTDYLSQGLFVWLVIIFVIAMQLVITFFCAYQGDLLNSDNVNQAMAKMGVKSDSVSNVLTKSTNYINMSGYEASKDTVRYWAISCYVMIALDVALLLVLLFMCSRIRIAIGIIREASKALQTMPSLVLYPIMPTIFAMGLVAYWVVAAAYIMTSANVSLKDVQNAASKITGRDAPPIKVEVENDDVVNYLLIYHLFGLLWTNQFIQAIAYTTLAGCFCEYYWTLDKRQIRGFVLLRSLWRTTRYHLGTMAFGSLIIAVVQMIRLGLEYIDQKMRATKQGNTFVKVVMCCLKCCMWCFEKVVKFLNQNAFIIVAMKGKSFCPAMKDSFLLLFNNAARVATVSIITRFLLVLGKLFIAAFSMFFMFLFIRHPPTKVPTFFMGDLSEISSPIFPMLVRT
ncbi:hypothetical protein P43SY_009670 [Pythium insidiosum]|uniref:Choline transporter-like protein n=1 Tax=Pythium insidiosum TaxID=114742 RepID=A0AAD5Q2J1_PYTIN|nr:hypothetical protein P43SY_009670 [Pythium insidiosum]